LEAVLPEPLSAEEVRRVCEALQQQPGLQNWYGTLNANRKALRYREHPVQIAGIHTVLEDLSPAADVHSTRYVNRLVAAEPRIEVASRSAEDAAVVSAQRAEDFDYAFLHDMMSQRPANVLSPYRRHVDDMVAYGAGFLRLSLSPKVVQSLPGGKFKDLDDFLARIKGVYDEGFKENPFIVECPALETVFFSPDLREVCEIGERTISQVVQTYDNLSYQDGHFEFTSDTMPRYEGSWQDTVTYYHLETEEFIYDLTEQKDRDEPFLLDRFPNVAGRPWYTITPGHMSNDPDPSNRFQPLIAGVYPTVQTMNVTRTLLQSGALNTGRPMYQEVANGRSGMDLPTIMTQPLEQRPVIHFDPSEQVLEKPAPGHHWEVVPAPSAEWVQSALERSQRDLQDWGFPIGLSPEAPTSGKAESGVQAMHDMEIAVNYLNPALTNVAGSLKELLLLVGDVVKGLDIPVTIPIRKRAEGESSRVRETVTVRPEDFREQDVNITLASEPATAKAAMRESDERMLQLGLMSRTTFMKRYYDDHLAELERIQIDKGYVFAEEQALSVAKAFIQANSQAIASEIAADLGIPLAPQTGGPSPGQEQRFQRPEVPVPGAGSPTVSPEQAVGGVPASIGTGQEVRPP